MKLGFNNLMKATLVTVGMLNAVPAVAQLSCTSIGRAKVCDSHITTDRGPATARLDALRKRMGDNRPDIRQHPGFGHGHPQVVVITPDQYARSNLGDGIQANIPQMQPYKVNPAGTSQYNTICTVFDGGQTHNIGLTDDKARKLQRGLNAMGLTGQDGRQLVVDADCGPNTEYALQRALTSGQLDLRHSMDAAGRSVTTITNAQPILKGPVEVTISPNALNIGVPRQPQYKK